MIGELAVGPRVPLPRTAVRAGERCHGLGDRWLGDSETRVTHRFVQVRRGITRTVLLVGGWVYKFPSLRPYGRGLAGVMWSLSRGIQANLSEAEWSTFVEDRDKIAPVTRSWLGGMMNVYPRCEPLIVVDVSGELPSEILAQVPELTGGPHGDLKDENLGWLDGRLVWLDYDRSHNGCCHDWSGALNCGDKLR